MPYVPENTEPPHPDDVRRYGNSADASVFHMVLSILDSYGPALPMVSSRTIAAHIAEEIFAIDVDVRTRQGLQEFVSSMEFRTETVRNQIKDLGGHVVYGPAQEIIDELLEVLSDAFTVFRIIKWSAWLIPCRNRANDFNVAFDGKLSMIMPGWVEEAAEDPF